MVKLKTRGQNHLYCVCNNLVHCLQKMESIMTRKSTSCTPMSHCCHSSGQLSVQHGSTPDGSHRTRLLGTAQTLRGRGCDFSMMKGRREHAVNVLSFTSERRVIYTLRIISISTLSTPLLQICIILSYQLGFSHEYPDLVLFYCAHA